LTGTELQPALQDEVGRHLLRGLPKPFPVNPQVLAAYAGRYQHSFDAEFTFCRNVSGEVDRMEAVVLGETLEAKKAP
jgi:hypothetical protein